RPSREEQHRDQTAARELCKIGRHRRLTPALEALTSADFCRTMRAGEQSFRSIVFVALVMREGYEPARPYYAVRPHDAQAPHASDPIAVMTAEVARFFCDLRGALRLSPEQAAHALSTRLDIIAALEQGLIGSLPPWPETCRIVRTYASFAKLDPRPILHQVEQLTMMAPRAPVAPPAGKS